jgi:hypothetical protein
MDVAAAAAKGARALGREGGGGGVKTGSVGEDEVKQASETVHLGASWPATLRGIDV